MSEETVKCTRTIACRWKGKEEDLVKKRDHEISRKMGVDFSVYVCPKCGNEDMYEIKPTP